MRHFLWMLLAVGLAMPSQAQDPQRLLAAVRGHLEGRGDHEPPRFQWAFMDLNGDGRSDAIVLMAGAHWCGTGGCDLYIFRGTRNGFHFLSSSTVTHDPLRVSNEERSGWKTLIVYSKGRGDVLLRFDGKRYPLNPSMEPKADDAQVRAAKTVIDSSTPVLEVGRHGS